MKIDLSNDDANALLTGLLTGLGMAKGACVEAGVLAKEKGGPYTELLELRESQMRECVAAMNTFNRLFGLAEVGEDGHVLKEEQ